MTASVMVVSAPRTLPTPLRSISCSMRRRSVSPTFGLIWSMTFCAGAPAATEPTSAVARADAPDEPQSRDHRPYGSSAGSARNGVAGTGAAAWAG